MRNDIINYATGKPVTTISVYYDKLVEEDKLKHIKRLNYLCFSLYRECRVNYKVTDKTAVCKIFQEIADTLSIPFQEVFDLWNDDLLLLRTKKRNPIFSGLSNDIFNQYVDGKTIHLYFVHEDTNTPLLGSLVFEPEYKYGITKPSWCNFLSRIDYALNLISIEFVNRRSNVYNTKVLVKELLNISNKEWKERVKRTYSEVDDDVIINYVWASEQLSILMDDYKIDHHLYMAILYISTNLTTDMSSRELLGETVINLASLIKEGKLRKHIKIEG
nr:MAG TPA: hypothetical protein [Caudoviricetes sp.]